MDGILDLERLLSRVTLETANPRDLLALAASLRASCPRCAPRWRSFACGALAERCTRSATNWPTCASASPRRWKTSLRSR